MSIQLGVNLGPSFADCCLIDTARPTLPLAYRRTYTPSEGISAGIRNFLAQNSQHKPTKAIIASSLLEKILDTKLGGTVAQVVTQGFESWAFLRQGLQNKYFELQPQRTEALASQELIFGVSERLNSRGEIVKPLRMEELDFIISKLKLMKVERVCMNFLFSEKNPVHLKQVSAHFQAAGFEVFSSLDPATKKDFPAQDEILSWRKNLLNASLSGSFKEILADVVSGCEGVLNPTQIEFLDGDSHHFANDSSRIASSLFGPARALSDFYNNSSQVLVLGLERWSLLKPQNKKNQWLSPWGLLAGEVPDLQDLKVQPTSALIVDEYDQLNFSSEVVGFEPGPMILGKAFKPTLFDFLHLHTSQWQTVSSHQRLDEILPQIQASGLSRLKDTLQAMLKNTSATDTRIETVAEELVNFIIDQMGLHSLLERDRASDALKSSITCTGALAPLLLPLLKKRWPEMNWDLCPYSLEIEGIAVAGRVSRGS